MRIRSSLLRTIGEGGRKHVWCNLGSGLLLATSEVINGILSFTLRRDSFKSTVPAKLCGIFEEELRKWHRCQCEKKPKSSWPSYSQAWHTLEFAKEGMRLYSPYRQIEVEDDLQAPGVYLQ
jgi:hypothetical protein